MSRLFFSFYLNRGSMTKHFTAESRPGISLLTSISFIITGRHKCTNSSVGSGPNTKGRRKVKVLEGGPSIAEHCPLFIAQPCVISQPSFPESSWIFWFLRSSSVASWLIHCSSSVSFSLIYSSFDLKRKSFLMFEHVFDVTYYCDFHKHANFEVQKPTNDCVFRCRQSS